MITQQFVDWIIRQHEGLDPLCKKNFLRKLKLTPGKMEAKIRGSIANWTGDYAFQTKTELIPINFGFDPKEVLNALQKHFKSQLARITE